MTPHGDPAQPPPPQPTPCTSEAAPTAHDPLQRARTALVAAGADAEAVAKLPPKTVQQLLEILSVAGAKSDLMLKMFNAVAHTSPAKTQKLTEIMGDYHGAIPILREFLTQMGQYDPFLAAARAQVLILPAERSGGARSASGHILTGVAYAVYDRDLASSTAGYISGKQALAKILPTFNPERGTTAQNRRSAVLHRKIEELDLSAAESIDLNALINDPNISEQLNSRLIARNLAVYTELRTAINECRAHLGSMIYGGDVVLPAIHGCKVRQDPGRQFRGWFEEHIKENPNTPLGIKIAFETLSDPFTELSPQEEEFYIRGLISYQKMHSFINKKIALDGLVKDLTQYDHLELSDPLRLNPAVEAARRTIQAELTDQSAEISVAQFSQLLDQASMVELRRTLNGRVLNQYREDFEAALRHFEFVSFTNGSTWREDVLQDAVPMDRLKQHLYGAKVGVARATDGPEKRRPLLGRSEFKAIIDAQFLMKLAADEQRFLTARPVVEFTAMVETVVVAYRKARILDTALLAHLSTTRSTDPTTAPVVQPEAIGETLNSWRPTLPVQTDLLPTERWRPPPTQHGQQRLSIREIAARTLDRGDLAFRNPPAPALEHEVRTHATALAVLAPAGLYLPESEQIWKQLEPRVRNLIPAEHHTDLINSATRLSASPLVAHISFATRLLMRQFLLASEIETLTAFRDQVHAAVTPHQGEDFNAATISERLQQRLHTTVFSGGVERGAYGSRLRLRAQEFPQFAGARHHLLPHGESFSLYDPAHLQAALDDLDRNYTELATLPERWGKDAQRLCSREGLPELQKRRFELVDRDTFQAASRLGIVGVKILPRSDQRWPYTYLVSNEFVNAVNSLIQTG